MNKTKLSQSELTECYYSTQDKFNHNLKKIKRALKFGTRSEIKTLKDVNSKLDKLLMRYESDSVRRFGTELFHMERSRKPSIRSEYGRSWLEYLTTGSVKYDAMSRYSDEQRKFKWNIFGTLTAGFRNFTAKSCRRLVEKYFEILCDNFGKDYPVKMFYVIEKFKTKLYEKDRFHVHFILDCPQCYSDIEFVRYLEDIKQNKQIDYPLHTIWQGVLNKKPEIIGVDNWYHIENACVPKTAKWHRVQFVPINENTEDYTKRIKYIIKYMSKEGCGVPHFSFLNSQTLMRERYRELIGDSHAKRKHLETLGCKPFSTFITDNGHLCSTYWISNKFKNKSKSKENYIIEGDIVSFTQPIWNAFLDSDYIHFESGVESVHVGHSMIPSAIKMDVSKKNNDSYQYVLPFSKTE